jgi:peroxiredoxin
MMNAMNLSRVKTAALGVAMAAAGCGYTVDTGPTKPPQTASSSGSSAPVQQSPAPGSVQPVQSGDMQVATAPLNAGDELAHFAAQTPTSTVDTRLALRNGPVVLVFFLGEWCVYCRRQLSEIQQRVGEFRALGADVWAVSSEGDGTTRAIVRDWRIGFPVVSDPEASVIGRFGVLAGGTGTALPSVFVLAASGEKVKVAWRKVGANQDDRASVNDMLNAVRAAGAH